MDINNTNLKFKPLTNTNKPKSIVLHHAYASSCSIYDIHTWHLNNGWSGCGYHYFVRKDGSVWRGRPDTAIGSHVAGYNTNTLGICAEGNYMTEIIPERQKQAIIELCKYLCKKYNINKIYGHGEVGSSSCPGVKYPLTEIKNEIFKKNDSYVKIDGGGTQLEDKPAINLIIKDYSEDITRVFAWIDNDKEASWAFDINPLNDSYVKLTANANKVINTRTNKSGFTGGATYKVTVKGYNGSKEVCKNNITLTIPSKEEKLYKIQLGAFKNKDNAKKYSQKLKEQGINNFIK